MLRMRDVSYRYPSGERVGPVDLEVRPGQVVLLTGPTGCGKSTVVRLAAGLLQRHGSGELSGTVEVAGADPGRTRPGERVLAVGFVAQEPRDQLLTGSLGDELAFGPESAGWPAARVEERITAMLSSVGLPQDPARRTGALSGGEAQRVVVAAALAAGAGLLVLDEPLSQLDPAGSRQLIHHLGVLAREQGVAILLVEHRLEAALGICDQLVVMERGQVVRRGPADALDVSLLRRLGVEVPGLLDLEDRLGARVDEVPVPVASPVPPSRPVGEVVLEARGLRWAYGDQVGLDGVDLTVRGGERLAVLGGNGSGKSTLLAALAGQLPAGSLRCTGRVVDVPQEPDLALFCATVRDEIAYGPQESRSSREQVEAVVDHLARSLHLLDLLERPPQALSRGQRQRVAVAAALACQPAVLVLDEPTSGQDRHAVEGMMVELDRELGERSLVFATHDVDLALRHATRLIVLDRGRVVLSGRPQEVLPSLDDPIILPPLAEWCLERGLPLLTAAQLAEVLS